MWETIVEFSKDQLASNDFLSGGIVVVILTGVLNYLRHLPMRAWNYARQLSHTSLTVYNSDNHAYRVLLQWLAMDKKIMSRNRQLTPEGFDDGKLKFGFGSSWFFRHGRLVRVRRSRDESSMTGDIRCRETVTMTAWGRSHPFLTKIMEEADKLDNASGERTVVDLYLPNGGSWLFAGHLPKRSIESTILKAGQMEEMLGNIKTFKGNREEYLRLGIPHRLGFLLEGPPGTGKTSTILTLASHFDAVVRVVNLSSTGIDDNSLFDLCTEWTDRLRFLVFEDADALFTKKRKTGKKVSVSFSGLLNALDGLMAGTKQVVFITTNHVEKLDPALLRPGRVDVRMTIDNLDHDQGVRMYDRFFPGEPGANDFATAFEGQSAATAQSALVTKLFGRDTSVDEIQEIELTHPELSDMITV